MKRPEFTKEQAVVIGAKDTNMLVSASAGAGKTSVMIERIATIVESGGERLENILVMTFTVESARDMKQKLVARLGAGRLVELSQMSIGTFHKFCADIVQTYFAGIGVNPSFEIADEAGAESLKQKIITEIIDDFAAKCPLAVDAYVSVYGAGTLADIIIAIADFLTWQPDPEGYIKNFAFAAYEANLGKNPAMWAILKWARGAGEYFADKLFSVPDCFAWAQKLKSVKSYDDIHAIAMGFEKLGRMKTDDPNYEFKEGLNDLLKTVRAQYQLPLDVVLKNQDGDRELVTQTLELVTEFIARYAAKKRELNVLDFADLESETIKILEDTQVVARLRERYKYIFVDEYQDTNPIQERILRRLAGDSAMFVVGDVKQSIYGFRGTSSAIFVDRMGEYGKMAGGAVAYLNKNFRSNAGILDFCNRIFGGVMRENFGGIDYEKTSKFDISGVKSAGNGVENSVEIVAIRGGTDETEANIIADRISKILVNDEIRDKETGEMRPVKQSDIAILAQTKTHFDVLVGTLERFGLRCITDKKTDIADIFEIELLNNVLLATNDLTYELPKILLMQSFVFDFSADEILEIRGGSMGGKLKTKYAAFENFLKKYNKLCKTETVATVLNTFLTEFDVINKLQITPDGAMRVGNIYMFLNKIRTANFASTIGQYTYAIKNQTLNIGIRAGAAGDCVRVTTIHSSKGLEYPIVFLYNAGTNFATEGYRKQIIADKNLGLCVYSIDTEQNTKRLSIARLGSIILAKRVQIEEQMRLLYVALTRAKDKLVIVGRCKGAYAPKVLTDFEISNFKNFFDIIRPTEVLNAEDIVIIPETPRQRVLSGVADGEVVAKFKAAFGKKYAFENATNAKVKTSVTAILAGENTWAEHFPTSRVKGEMYGDGSGTEYGTKFHVAMQTGVAFDTATEVAIREMDKFTAGFDTYRELVVFQNVEVGGEKILVQGVIDLLCIGSARAFIVDYKTTKGTAAVLRARYQKQLDLYALAVEKALGRDVEKFIYSTHLGEMIKL